MPGYARGNNLCPQLPYDVDFPFQAGYTAILDPKIQPAFDMFSWQSFAALNWPADSAGNPLGNSIGAYADVPRVWEHYPDIAEVFDAQTPLLLKVKEAGRNKQKAFYMISKFSIPADSLNEVLNPDEKPLIDRNLNFAVFAVNTNPVEANFIISNNLNTKKGIDSFYRKNGKQFALPPSVIPNKEQKGSAGSMEIKTSWRILDTSKGDIPSRYYTREALIYVDADNSVSGKAFTIKALVGLTGMHIVRKTARFTTWVWSTFEHVDNTPDNMQAAQDEVKHRWSYYNTSTLGLTPNQPAAFQPGDNKTYKFDSTKPYAKRYADSVAGEHFGEKVYGTQAQRMYPIYYRTEQVNKAWQNKLQGTVWANYKLIGSQWTAADPGVKNSPNVPNFLGNSSLETFQLINASCLTCHKGAAITYGKETISTDFSFMIAFNAQ
ncbi:hypothetical protein [Paraflavitalea speifideaquila]|uniref:hypothetical protein n=1 Tax=Paraflavitalea speifideaquila TaxID=3076558 RepID=UPI0028E67706|nr:hypothetical protein [Paraflavitalea speifideiaquila]